MTSSARRKSSGIRGYMRRLRRSPRVPKWAYFNHTIAILVSPCTVFSLNRAYSLVEHSTTQGTVEWGRNTSTEIHRSSTTSVRTSSA
jgi:hypothetical protein